MRKNNPVLLRHWIFFISEMPNGAETELKNDQGQASKRVVYLPDLHPKLIHFLKSSPSLKNSLEEKMNSVYTEIDWLKTEDGKTLKP